MKRRELMQRAAALSFVAVVSKADRLLGTSGLLESRQEPPSGKRSTVTNPLKPPAHGNIPVAFVISEGAVLIDFAGPWEVFNSSGHNGTQFDTYTVAETLKPIRTDGGMKIIPNHTFVSAPAPKVIVIPAQSGKTEAMLEWIRKSAKGADITMSVCTGASVLASTGLLSGKSATTHHAAYKQLAVEFPDIKVKRGVRFVEEGNLASSGGLSSGIDLALHVVERYFGRQAAESTAYHMEYQGEGWTNPESNSIYAKEPISTDAHPRCPVCNMEVDPAASPKSVYKGKTYYFMNNAHKAQFDAAPEKWIQQP